MVIHFSTTCFRRAGFVVAALGLVAMGCSSRPAAIPAPDVDPDQLGEALLSEHDADGNGSLSASELEALPAINHRRDAYDADKNGQVDLHELTSRLERVFDGRTGLMAAACRVTHNGKPLKDAIVHFVPIPTIDGSVAIASGVTLTNGTTMLSIRQEDLPPNSPQRAGLVQPGLYFVEVTHDQLKIPEQYNVKTTLGREISPEVALAGAIEVPLKF
jgi:hypothetical protein